MEEKFEFTFVNGTVINVVLGEDGYNVNIWGVDKPLMGTFTSFENLVKGIGDVVISNASEGELDKFVEELSLSLSNTYVIDEIKEML